MITYHELSSIENDLGIPIRTLFGVSNNLDKHYRKVKIPKRSGGFRTLTVPDDVLKKIQRAIVESILIYMPVSKYATAYKYGASVQKNARVHVAKSKILKLDIRHFFDSILYSTVKNICFPADRYSETIRVLLSMLCYYKDSLPQGAPSSPVISNIIMRDFDEEIGAWCRERKITYTRYCDDMTFSGNFDESEIIRMIKTRLQKYGFVLNSQKTKVAKQGQRQTVTGITVNNKLNVCSEYRREIRQAVYYCKKYGVSEHIMHTGANVDATTYLHSLLGKIAFVLQTTPDNAEFQSYKKDILALIEQYKA